MPIYVFPTAKYFEDYKVGEKFGTPGRTMTEADIANFAGVSGDFAQEHTDEEYARSTTVFKTRVVHGMLTLVASLGLFTRLGLMQGTGLAEVGLNNVKFTKPVKIGDTIRSDVEILSKRESRKPDRGVVITKHVCKNQDDEAVAEYEVVWLVQKRET